MPRVSIEAVRTELFRPEAVAAHAEAAAAGRSLPSSRRLLTQATTGLAAALIAAVGTASVVKVDETSEGTWSTTVDPATATVVVPVGALGRLEPGQTVRFDAADIEATVSAPAQAIPRTDGGAQALVPVTIDGQLPANAGGEAVVVLDRRSLLDLVVDAFGRGFRRG